MILRYLRNSKSSLKKHLSDCRFQGKNVLRSKSKKKARVLFQILLRKSSRKQMFRRKKHLKSAFAYMVNVSGGRLNVSLATLAGLENFATYRIRKKKLFTQWMKQSLRFLKLKRLRRHMPIRPKYRNRNKQNRLRLMKTALLNRMSTRRMLHLFSSQHQRSLDQLFLILLGCKYNICNIFRTENVVILVGVAFVFYLLMLARQKISEKV